MTNILQAARNFAQWVHRDQVRKYTGEPYFIHLEEVSRLLWDNGFDDDPEVVAAGYLHDIVEDQPITVEMLEVIFGARVAELVSQVTDVSRPEDGNRAHRKMLDREHLGLSSSNGASIKLADTISNTKSILMHDPKFARTYFPEKKLLLPLLMHGSPKLFEEATKWVTKGMNELGL